MVVTTLSLLLALQSAPTEQDYYRIDTIPVPDDVVLEVGGIEFLPDGRIAACTRRGQVWYVGEECTLFAEGLQEPLGLLLHEGWLYTVQRGELSRMRDTDGDDRMDELETIADPWPISGNYHEYNFGPVLADDGSLWITTNKPFGGEPFGRADWRGFALRFMPGDDGWSWQPMCCGLRSPAGIAKSPWGDLFYTDNQGEWCGASKMSMLRPGSNHGHPWGLFSCEREEWTFGDPGDPPNEVLMPLVHETVPTFELPAVWFPYDKTGRSPAGFDWDVSDGVFGPFQGQAFVGDQYQASLNRVFLEEIDGRIQGAVFPFRKGLASGVTRAKFAPDGALIVGSTDRGWGALGMRTFGLERVTWTGAMPFEIQEMRAAHDGFVLEFTTDVDMASANDPASYAMISYTYELHASYGSAEMDKQTLSITSASVAPDGKTVHLRVPGLRSGYVHELTAEGVRASDGRTLLHQDAYYTLVAIPSAPEVDPSAPKGGLKTRDVDERFEDGKPERVGKEALDADGEWVRIGAWQEGEYPFDYYGHGAYELSEGRYVDGERDGLWKTFDAEGRAVRNGRYAAGLEVGRWTWFHGNGQASIAGDYEAGTQVGKWTWFHEDGQVLKSGSFDENGRDQGTWQWWHENGQVWREGEYEDGAAIGTWTEWHENGQVASIGELAPEPEEDVLESVHGDRVRYSHREGPWKVWWPNGQLREEGVWERGRRVGPHRYWGRDGAELEGPVSD